MAIALPVLNEQPVHLRKNLEDSTKLVLARSLGQELDPSNKEAMERAPMINDGEAKASIAGVRLYEALQGKGKVYVDMVGCGIGNCVHCYVPKASLKASLEVDKLQEVIHTNVPAGLRKKFPQSPEGKLIPIASADDVFEQAYAIAQKYHEKTGNSVDLALGSGEPLANRAFVLRFVELAKKHDMTVWIDTTGLPGISKDYFKPFVEKGLQRSMHIYFSPKGTTPEEYEKFTQGVDGKNWVWPFLGLNAALESGIPAQMQGVMVDHFASESQLKQADNPVTRLMDELRKIHELLPMLVTGLNTTTGRIAEPQRQIEQLKRQGYSKKNGYGARNLVRDTMQEVAMSYGTPMLMPNRRKDFTPEKEEALQSIVMEKILSDLSENPPKRTVSDTELRTIKVQLHRKGIDVPGYQQGLVA